MPTDSARNVYWLTSECLSTRSVFLSGIGEAAARYLAANSCVVGVGIDTASIDPGISQTFMADRILLGANRFALENLRDLSRVPPKGARLDLSPH